MFLCFFFLIQKFHVAFNELCLCVCVCVCVCIYIYIFLKKKIQKKKIQDFQVFPEKEEILQM